MTDRLLRDVLDIPDSVHYGTFVLKLARSVSAEHAAQTVRDYVATPQLAEEFDKALGVIKTAVQTQSSHAAYLDGSFGSGKSHFMAVLHAVLRGDPVARGKDELVPVIAKHDDWLGVPKFLLVPYHIVGASTLDAAILGGYVSRVAAEFPDKEPPAVYRDDALLADAKELRAEVGDDEFIAKLGTSQWRRVKWDAALLDAAFAAPASDRDRRRLVGALLQGPFKRYAAAVSGDAPSFLPLDEGLSVISEHAKHVLGHDAIVLLLDELVLWLAGWIGDPAAMRREVEKVSKLVESAQWERPAPIISFVPRQRDLRELVGRDVAGTQTANLFDALKYWDARFDHLKLENRNLRAIVQQRILRPNPKNPQAKAELDAAFDRATRTTPQVWDVLLNSQGESATREDFRATYPFSPAFVAAMVDISEALQRERSAIKLMFDLLVKYRDTLPVGQLVPLGAIYDVLADGQDQPFTDKLRDEFSQVKRFYTEELRPHLLRKHSLADGQAITPAFRADDLVVKTLLLAALVPQVPALRNLTASRLAALNHGSIKSMLSGGERTQVAQTLRGLANEFGAFHVAESDDPAVEVALIGVDTRGILALARHVDDDAAKRRYLQKLLWEKFGVPDDGRYDARKEIVWRGTRRVVELVFANVRDESQLDTRQFEPAESDALRVIIDYPFDEPTFGPAEDRRRVLELQADRPRSDIVCWLPHFLSGDRFSDLGDLVVIDHVLEGDRLEREYAVTLTEDDRHHARSQLTSRKQALRHNLAEVLRKAYGLAAIDEADLGRRTETHLLALDSAVDLKPPAGLGFADALPVICGKLLDHRYDKHPDLDPDGRRTAYRPQQLDIVWQFVEEASQQNPPRVEARNEGPVLRRIGHPLELGTMHEAHFVLQDTWPMRIEEAANRARISGDLKISDIHDWIDREVPGLPKDIRTLIAACYASQRDRAWIRAGQVVDVRELRAVHGDMQLRAQELPTESEFTAAGERATALLRTDRQPVRSARAVHALGTAVRHRSSELLPDADELVKELERHAEVLQLAESTRLSTARAAAALLERLAGTTDDTAVLRALAAAELPRPSEVYRASLESAKAVVAMLASVRWQILESVAARQDEPARVILERLRGVAAHDEHAAHLAPALQQAEQDAIALVSASAPPTPEPPPPPPGRTVVRGRRQVRVSELDDVLREITDAAGELPDGTVDVSWQITDQE